MPRNTRWVWLVGLLALAGCRKVAEYTPAGDATIDGATIDGAVDRGVRDGASEGDLADGAADRRVDDGFTDGVREVGLPADGGGDIPRDQAVDGAPPLLPLPPLVACGSGTWCWAHPRPQGNDLHGLFCTSNGDCFAVGDVGTLLYRPAGGSWEQRQSATESKLRAVWVDEATRTIVVVGGNQVGRWTGLTWVYTQHLDLPDLTSVWGLSPTDLYVGAPANVMAATKQGLWRFDTTKFIRLESEPVVELWGDGTKVYALLPNAVKVADGTSVATALYGTLGLCPSFGGGEAVAFAPLSTTFPPSAFFVLMSVSNKIYQVGQGSCASFGTSPVAARAIASVANEVFVASDKSIHRYVAALGGWQPSPYLASAAVNRLVHAGSGVRAVGDLGGLYEGGSGGWQEESTRLTTRRLWAVAMVANGLYAGGDGGTMLQESNGTWALMPASTTNTGHIYALAGTASELRAVSASGNFLFLIPGPATSVSAAAGKPLYALRRYTSDYLVGGKDTLLQCGTSCANAFGGYTGTVRAVQLLGQDAIVASSDEGSGSETAALVRIVGSPRQVLPQVDTMGQNITVPIYGLWGTGTEMRAVGHGGTVLLRGSNNDEWSTEPTPGDAKGRLYAIAGRSSNELWAVGEGGLILSRTAAGWTRWKPFVSRQSLTSVAVDQNGQAWAVGAGGAILHYTP